MDAYKQTNWRDDWLVRHSTGVFFLLSPAVAWSAEQIVRTFERDVGTNLFVFLFSAGIVQVLWIMGYCASSLPKWAKWHDGTRIEKFEVLSGAFGAACSGNILYYGGLYGADVKEIYCFIAAIIGGFAGDRVLNMITDRYVNKVTAP